ncbi:MAG: ATP-binding protein, partial [Deltaproteobacteria bacterium]
MKLNSIKFKISILYTAILGIILILYSSILYFSLQYTLYRDLDHDLVVKAQEVSNVINSYLNVLGYNQRSFIFSVRRVIRQEGEHPDQDKIASLEKLWIQTVDKLNIDHDYVNFISYKGEPIASSNNLDENLFSAFLKASKSSHGKAVYYKDIELGKDKLRLISIPFYYKSKTMYLIQIGTSLKSITKVLHNKLFFILLGIPLVLLLTSFLGRIIAVRILKPVLEITKTARNITYKDLRVRVKTEHADEEMQYLVDAFNDMISRLDKSFKYIAEFSSDVAHELKTPLAIIRGESEIALKKERESEEYKRVIKVNLEETERMRRTIEDLLLLTKLDYSPQVFKFAQIDFIEFFKEIYEQENKLAARKNIVMHIAMPNKPINIQADRLHLRRLFFNLINNAIKFTPENGRIGIVINREANKAAISISDTGVGIAKEDLDKIFNRFFHIDRSEQEAESGSGLGLSIAQSIAKIHGGEIT